MADQELFQVRSDFIDNVSKEVISQLLDDLLHNGILNDGESESVLEENLNRRGKARQLIDTVRRKGHEASSKMIACLQKRDPTLHSTLGLSSGQPVPPAAEANVGQKWLTSPRATTKAFWREKQNIDDIYPSPIKSIQSRVALLITNIQFADAKLNRSGAERDEENMERLLKALGYEVVKYRNLTGKEIDDAIIKFSKHPKLQETDSVWVVIMSHGKLGAILGFNYKHETPCGERPDEFPIDNIYKHLGPSKCKALLDKPKIIVIQACRGEEGGSVLVCDSANPEVCAEPDPEEDTLRCVHKEKDFISLLSCTPDAVSYRHRDHGSFLIQFIVEVFSTYAYQDHIDELFRKVLRRFEDFAIQSRRQMPTKDRCTLTKHFYLFPGVI